MRSSMKDINLAFIGKNDVNRMTSFNYYFRKELEKHVNVKYFWHKSRYGDILDRLGSYKPDVIYLGPPRQYWHNLDKFDVPKICWWSDPHSRPIEMMNWIEKQKIDVSLHAVTGDISKNKWGLFKVADRLPEWHQPYMFPISVNTTIFNDFKYERPHDFLEMGRSGRSWYPIRTAVRKWFKTKEDKYDIVRARRPKRDYRVTKEKVKNNSDLYARESYSDILNRTKIFPMCGGIHRYAGGKMFEAMACKCLILMQPPAFPEVYHFEDGINYIEIDFKNYADKLEYWIENYDTKEVRLILQNAYNMIRKRHSNKKRCEEFIAIMEKELAGGRFGMGVKS